MSQSETQAQPLEMERMGIYLEPGLSERLRIYKARTRKSLSSIAAQAIEDFLDHEETSRSGDSGRQAA